MSDEWNTSLFPGCAAVIMGRPKDSISTQWGQMQSILLCKTLLACYTSTVKALTTCLPLTCVASHFIHSDDGSEGIKNNPSTLVSSLDIPVHYQMSSFKEWKGCLLCVALHTGWSLKPADIQYSTACEVKKGRVCFLGPRSPTPLPYKGLSGALVAAIPHKS